MCTENFLLGIDLGTTNIKGVIIREDGRVIASASRPCRPISPALGYAEQDANDWWERTSNILKELTAKAGTATVNSIRAICVSSQVVSLLPVNKEGNPLRNAILYQDSRSSGELDEICRTIGTEHFAKIVGGQPGVAFLANKLLWFQKNEPELLAQTYAFLQANGYINYKLTGVFSLDADCASRLQCFNISDLSYSDEIARATGVDIRTLIPNPVKCTDIIGCVTEEAASLTGLAAGIPVAAGTSDAMASMYATGISELGDAGESSGTTSLVFVGSPQKSAPDVPVVTRPCYIKGIPYIFDAPISATGASIKWYIDSVGETDKEKARKLDTDIYQYLEQTASKVSAGSNGLLYFPYLVAGERAPLWNSHAKGMYIGLTVDTTRAHMLRAIYEGTAFALRHVIETVKESGAHVTSLRVTGGGAGSIIWNQIKASMLHLPVYTLDDNGGGVPLGDCIIAGTAVGLFSDLSASIRKIISVKEKFDPIPEWEKKYDIMYPYYIEMYSRLDETLKSYKESLNQ